MDLLSYKVLIQFKSINEIIHLFDPIRKKWLKITPEEIVRQCIIHYLIKDRDYSPNLISIEKLITYHQLKKRYDIVVFDRNAVPLILIECKAPDLLLGATAKEQISLYQQIIDGGYLWISNGHQNLIYKQTAEPKGYEFIESIPHQSECK
jgi:type I site-specific restriction-modification system R (restriction) subunit